MLDSNFTGWPSFSLEECDAVKRVLLSGRVNYWTGTECRKFEQEFGNWVGTRYAIALANGTLALDAAMKAIDVGPGDEVIVTPRTFIASVSCVVNAGATPVFADVEFDSGNISARTIEAVLTSRTKAVICVHLAGWPCDMDPIMALAEAHNLKVIEDCAQAHGAKYKGRFVGSIGHVGAWSYCQDKIMTTGGEGGMVTTNDESLWRVMWSYKDHGKSYEAVYEKHHLPGFRWLHESFGTNWRMIEIQAAIGRIQLQRMQEWRATRLRNANKIWDSCRKFSSLRVPEFKCPSCEGGCNNVGNDKGCVHAHYKCYVYVRLENLEKGWNRDRIIDEIKAKGVPCFQGSCSEVYLEKAFDNSGWRPDNRLLFAKMLGETSLMFLVHPTLTDSEIQWTCQAIDHVMSKANV
jgi:dTDP-4-amino-4,6-dideoxygalactose transaminase